MFTALGMRETEGYKDHGRIRIGDWRAAYIIEDVAKVVSVTRIAQRREVCE
jgi:mRNA-degrading endonuclease RelE of RelBE toxin-antitoxin system